MRIFILLVAVLFSLPSISQNNICVSRDTFHIVVIGSSTAAGAGASRSDSAWVNRYRNYLQTINPANQVTNLARGGYNTYRLQPNNYIAPAGRPAVDSSRNISQAISLNPDGIIVNLPSNDASAGYGVNEQMTNFIRIKNVADSFNIPVWICTTQPRNFPVSKRLIQTETRDSILSYFGNMALDFWTGLANSTNQLDSVFDSGDGVHLNDRGHRLLFERAVQKQILDTLASPLNFTDFIIRKQGLIAFSTCGDSSQLIEIEYGNLGSQLNQVQSLTVVAMNQSNMQADTVRVISSRTLGACESEVVQLNLNLAQIGKYEIRSFLTSLDTVPLNDTATSMSIEIIGTPAATNLLDSVCLYDTIALTANNHHSDQVVWYADSNQNQLLKLGDSLEYIVNKDTAFFYQVVRGDLYYSGFLETGQSTSTNWNGIMINLIALDTIVIDSFYTKLHDTGLQNVQAYYRNGAYNGFENNSSAWNNWGTDTILVNHSGDFYNLDFTPQTVNQGDTLGVYLHLANPSARLSYRSSGTNQSFSNQQLLINSGSGVSHTFGATFNPRNFVGKIHYHYGTRLEGACASALATYNVKVHPQSFDLGNDTSISLGQNVTLVLPPTFSSVLWSTGDTSKTLVLDQSNLNLGNNNIQVNALDEKGCFFSDTINILLNVTLGLEGHEGNNTFTIFPNPSNNFITIKSRESFSQLLIFNQMGQLIKEQHDINENIISVNELAEGMYWMQIESNSGEVYRSQFIIQR